MTFAPVTRRDPCRLMSTTDDLDTMHSTITNRRKGSRNIVVDAETLWRLLQDHHTMANAIEEIAT